MARFGESGQIIGRLTLPPVDMEPDSGSLEKKIIFQEFHVNWHTFHHDDRVDGRVQQVLAFPSGVTHEVVPHHFMIEVMNHSLYGRSKSQSLGTWERVSGMESPNQSLALVK